MLLNLQAYRDLDPSEKDAAAETYNTGLEVDFEDILERSRRRRRGDAGSPRGVRVLMNDREYEETKAR